MNISQLFSRSLGSGLDRFNGLDRLLIIGLTSLPINLLGLAVPLALLQVYNRIIPNQADSSLSVLVMGVGTALLVEAVLRALRAYYIGWIGARFEHQIGCQIFHRLLSAPPKELEKADGAKHMERMGAIHVVGELYSGQAIMALFDLPFLLLYLYLILQLGATLAVIPLTALVTIVVASIWVGGQLRTTLQQDVDLSQRRFSFITESLNYIHSIKSFAMEGLMLRRHDMLQAVSSRQTHRIIFLGNILPAISSFASQCTTALVMGMGAIMVIDGQLTTGSLAACMMLAGRALHPMQTLVSSWTRLQSIRMAHAQVQELLAMPQRQEATPGAPVESRGILTVNDLTFAYGDTPAILEQVTLSIQPGECIGIVGESGGGKTTFLKLMAGKLAPTTGEILLDGHNLDDLPPELLRSIAYVPQKGTLFSGTILQNLTMFDSARHESALRMATLLGLDDLVSRMPKGYHTIVGDGASDTLPTGVIQRISIVRMLALEPKILLFDESNTAIDSKGDSLLKSCLADLKKHCAIILISQRPFILSLADRLYRLRDSHLTPMASLSEMFEPSHPVLVHAPITFPAQHGAEASFFPVDAPLDNSPHQPHIPSWQEFIDDFPFASPFSRCLKALLASLQWKGSSRQLAEALPHLFGTLDLAGLCITMANLNFFHRQETGHIHEIDPRLTPYLFVSEKGATVVVTGKDGAQGQDVFDGQDGSWHNRIDLGRGVAFFFQSPGQDAVKAGGWIKNHLSNFSSLVVLTMTITILGNIMATATPLFTMLVYDRIIPSGSSAMGVSLLIGVLLAIALDTVMRMQRVRILAFIGAKSERVLTTAILERLFALPAALTERASVGSQVARIKSLEVMREMFTGVLAYLYYDAPTTIFFLIVLSMVNRDVIYFMLLLIILLGLLGGVLLPAMRSRSAHAAKLLAQRQTFLTEAFSRVQIIHDTHASQIWYRRYREISGKAAYFAFRQNIITALLGILSHSITMGTAVGVMAMTATGVMEGTTTAGAVIASMMLTWRIFNPIQTTFLGISKMVQIMNSMNQINRLMEMKGERDPGTHPVMEKRFKGKVSFHRVSFRYSSDAEPALVGVTFEVPAGSVVSIIGANGSGKSTLLKMILGLYTPQAGSIMIDNGDIRQTDPTELRHAISYLPQSCDIFFGTVAQNLKLVNPVATLEEMMIATQKAGILDEILSLPEGFQTRLQESRSEQLSSGFKQRLSLARAYLKQSPIILLDEPGNSLDAESERLFREAVTLLRGKATLFIVTHRPSHLQLSDMFLYLDNGYLRAAGPPKEIGKLLPKGFV